MTKEKEEKMTEEGKNILKAKKCWEYLNCKVYQNCPAYPTQGLNCWMTTGTLCRGEKQGNFMEKIEKCKQCVYYKYRRG